MTPEERLAKSQKEVSEEALTWWAQRQRELNETRDGLVLQALGWGISKHRVHVLTGIARTTIDRIIQAAGECDCGVGSLIGQVGGEHEKGCPARGEVGGGQS